jgi:hypothetical protein
MAGELHGIKDALESQIQYMASLSTRDWFGGAYAQNDLDIRRGDYCDPLAATSTWPEADVLRKVLTRITELQGKSQTELRYAKVEAAWGKLNAKDLETICQLERNILLPIIGIESLSHTVNRIEKRGGWDAVSRLKMGRALAESEYTQVQDGEKEQWDWILGWLCSRAQRLHEAMIVALDESLYDLQLEKRPSSSVRTDIEANGLHWSPRDRDMVADIERMIQQFLAEREDPLKEWCASKGIDKFSLQNNATQTDYSLQQRYLSQLYLVLNVSISVLAFTMACMAWNQRC